MHDAMPSALINKFLVLSLSTTVAMGLCSCSKPDIRQTTSRVAAPVNGEEMHQIDGAFARNSNMTSDQVGLATVLARERLIDQELLVQEALLARLNRDAQVAQAIEQGQAADPGASLSRTGHDFCVASEPAGNPQFLRRQSGVVRRAAVFIASVSWWWSASPERFGAFAGGGCRGKKSLGEVVRGSIPGSFLSSRSIQPGLPNRSR